MEQQAGTIIGVLILTGILWIARSVSQTKERLAVLQTILIGENGNNGLSGEVKHLRGRNHDIANVVQALGGKVELLDFRVSTLEENGNTT